jgi:4'-phosphopantetheinyl transferase
LKKLLGSYLGMHGSQLRFLKNTYGKPYLKIAGAPYFNLSHSGDICVIGIAGRGDVGVDVELHREIADLHDLAEMVLSADERTELRTLPDSAAATAGFLRGWTRKEAVIKALGLGIGINLQAVTVGLQPAAREVGPVSGISARRLRVQSFYRAPGEYIAVAHDPAVRRIELRTPDVAEIEAL